MSNSRYNYKLAVWSEQPDPLDRSRYTMLKALVRWDPVTETGVAVLDLSYVEAGVTSTVYTIHYSRFYDTYVLPYWDLTTLREL